MTDCMIKTDRHAEGRYRSDAGNRVPGYPDRVFAHWYSGTLRIPKKLLEYIHMGYGGSYERDRFLKIEKGVVGGSHIRHNGDTNSDGPEGYGIRSSEPCSPTH